MDQANLYWRCNKDKVPEINSNASIEGQHVLALIPVLSNCGANARKKPHEFICLTSQAAEAIKAFQMRDHALIAHMTITSITNMHEEDG